jgi:hypothetical protein
MRGGQFAISFLLSLACVGLAGYTIYVSIQNRELARQVQQQQTEINRGAISQQIGRNLVRDMASASMKNSRIKELLVLSGFTVSENSAEETRKP